MRIDSRLDRSIQSGALLRQPFPLAQHAMTGVGSDVEYNRVELGGRVVKGWGPHTFSLWASGGSALGSEMPAYDSFTLGGPLRLSAYRLNELAGRQYSFGRLMYYNRTVALPELLGSGVFVGGSVEVGRISDRADNLPADGPGWSVSSFLAAVTFLKPGHLGVGVGLGRWSLFLLLGAP